MKSVHESGRNVCQESYHITANGTITVVDHSVFLEWLHITVSNAGSGATIAVLNRETPPKAVIPPTTLTDPGADVAGQLFNPNPPRHFWCENGIDIVTAGNTPGTVDCWITWNDEI